MRRSPRWAKAAWGSDGGTVDDAFKIIAPLKTLRCSIATRRSLLHKATSACTHAQREVGLVLKERRAGNDVSRRCEHRGKVFKRDWPAKEPALGCEWHFGTRKICSLLGSLDPLDDYLEAERLRHGQDLRQDGDGDRIGADGA